MSSSSSFDGSTYDHNLYFELPSLLPSYTCAYCDHKTERGNETIGLLTYHTSVMDYWYENDRNTKQHLDDKIEIAFVSLNNISTCLNKLLENDTKNVMNALKTSSRSNIRLEFPTNIPIQGVSDFEKDVLLFGSVSIKYSLVWVFYQIWTTFLLPRVEFIGRSGMCGNKRLKFVGLGIKRGKGNDFLTIHMSIHPLILGSCFDERFRMSSTRPIFQVLVGQLIHKDIKQFLMNDEDELSSKTLKTTIISSNNSSSSSTEPSNDLSDDDQIQLPQSCTSSEQSDQD